MTCDFWQCGILTSVDSDEAVQPTVKFRNTKCCSDSSLSHRIFKWLIKALISLHIHADWSEPLLVAYTILLEISCRGSYEVLIRVRTGLKSNWIYRTVLKSPWKLNLSWKVLEKHWKALKSPWILTFTGGFNTVFGYPNQYKLVYLYFVQHMLHQIKATQCYSNFLKQISLKMQSSIFDVEI